MVIRGRHALPSAVWAMVFLLGCDSSTSGTSTRDVEVRIRPAESLSLLSWERTHSIQLKATTSQLRVILDTVLPFQAAGVPAMRTPADEGLILEASGSDSAGLRIWESTLAVPGSPSARSSVLSLTLEASSPPRLTRVGVAEKPRLLLETGASDSACRIVLVAPTPSTTIHYSLDGSNPTLLSRKYSAPFETRIGTRLRAIALGEEHYPSLVLDTTPTVRDLPLAMRQ